MEMFIELTCEIKIMQLYFVIYMCFVLTKTEEMLNKATQLLLFYFLISTQSTNNLYLSS